MTEWPKVDHVKVHRAMRLVGDRLEAERVTRIASRDAHLVAEGWRTCDNLTPSRALCGKPTRKKYLTGWRCPTCTPAALSGRPESVPDPARTMDGIRTSWYVKQGREPVPMATPVGETLIDQRAKASGKRRSATNDYRAARAATDRSTR